MTSAGLALSCQMVAATEHLSISAKCSIEAKGRLSAIKLPTTSPKILAAGFKPKQLRIQLLIGPPSLNAPVSRALP